MVDVPSKEEFTALQTKVNELTEQLTELTVLSVQHESDIIQLKAAVADIIPKPLPTDVKAALNIVMAWIAAQ